ncbi:potassium transporter Kef [Dietzia sp. NCCP-2495]|uniref:cation:proton antiporter n=1 Tax=Dietzia sp. NCCP-2495 TaxID=2934675 RepID=UPI002230850E|nr:cation:proton antiporter [Dietzia sp. NCCP-2495]GLB63965.1 potassium transporter Kef [Dietzia sp. NCCP-2495]
MTTTVLASGTTPADIQSLFWIVLVICVAPVLSWVTRSYVPAVVLLLAGGMLIGPSGLGLAVESGGVEMLGEIGLGLLFLLAGLELKPSALSGRRGAGAVGAWLTSVVLATGIGWAVTGRPETAIALGLLLTSTAIGTLLPILKGAGHDSTPVGQAVLSHGAVGELGPVLAMALLLGTRDIGSSAVAVALFGIAALFLFAVPRRLLFVPAMGRALAQGNTSTGQLVVRMVFLLLAAMMAVATVFDLGVVLGAFAAGMVLRSLMETYTRHQGDPTGDAAGGGATGDRDLVDDLLGRLDTIGYSLFIPVFFVVSGMGISAGAVTAAPWLLLAAVATMLVIRGGIVWLAETWIHVSPGLTTARERARAGLYAATGLPIIVAVTDVAVGADLLRPDVANVLVAAGALTVLVFPLVAELLHSPDDAAEGPGSAGHDTVAH